MATFKLDIFTPYSHYLSTDVDFVSVWGEEYVYGILPNHTLMVSKVRISILKVVIDGKENLYAIGGGVMYIDESHNMKLLLDSIESKSEIDLNRALDAKLRAEARLNEKSDEIDIARAESSLKRALNRINLINL